MDDLKKMLELQLSLFKRIHEIQKKLYDVMSSPNSGDLLKLNEEYDEQQIQMNDVIQKIKPEVKKWFSLSSDEKSLYLSHGISDLLDLIDEVALKVNSFHEEKFGKAIKVLQSNEASKINSIFERIHLSK